MNRFSSIVVLACLVLLVSVIKVNAKDLRITWNMPDEANVLGYRFYYLPASLIPTGLDAIQTKAFLDNADNRKTFWVQNVEGSDKRAFASTTGAMNLEVGKTYLFFVCAISTCYTEGGSSNSVQYFVPDTSLDAELPERPKPPLTIVVPSGTTILVNEVP